jgi:hypothetical protein
MAIGEMERGGYLSRLWLGRDQRLSVESVRTWERTYRRPASESVRGEITHARTRNFRVSE